MVWWALFLGCCHFGVFAQSNAVNEDAPEDELTMCTTRCSVKKKSRTRTCATVCEPKSISAVTFVDSKLEKLKKQEERKQRPALIKKELQRRAYLRKLQRQEEVRRERDRQVYEADKRRREAEHKKAEQKAEQESDKKKLEDYVQKYIRDYAYRKKQEIKEEGEQKLKEYAEMDKALAQAPAQ